MSFNKHFGGFERVSEMGRLSDRLVAFSLLSLLTLSVNVLSGCVMTEEMKRIDAQKKAEARRDESGSTNLTGEQIFVRTCNTCHPQGRAGMGPKLDKVAVNYPDDAKLKALIRNGKGIMPGQSGLNDQELDNIVGYVRGLTFDK